MLKKYLFLLLITLVPVIGFSVTIAQKPANWILSGDDAGDEKNYWDINNINHRILPNSNGILLYIKYKSQNIYHGKILSEKEMKQKSIRISTAADEAFFYRTCKRYKNNQSIKYTEFSEDHETTIKIIDIKTLCSLQKNDEYTTVGYGGALLLKDEQIYYVPTLSEGMTFSTYVKDKLVMNRSTLANSSDLANSLAQKIDIAYMCKYNTIQSAVQGCINAYNTKVNIINLYALPIIQKETKTTIKNLKEIV